MTTIAQVRDAYGGLTQQDLPHTGADLGPLALFGLVLIVLGAAIARKVAR